VRPRPVKDDHVDFARLDLGSSSIRPPKLSNKMPGRFFGDTWFATAPGHDGVSSAPTDRPEGILPQPLRWGEYER